MVGLGMAGYLAAINIIIHTTLYYELLNILVISTGMGIRWISFCQTIHIRTQYSERGCQNLVNMDAVD